jgi:hypothetical protein
VTVVVPEPIPLDLPDEHADAVADLVLSVAGAADSLALVGDGLAGTAHAVPHWVGADADAAAAQLGVLRELTRACSVAVLSAAGRLSVHSDRLGATCAAIAALQAEQHEDVAATWRRLSQLPDYLVAVRNDAPEAQAIVEELRATEEARRRRHAALLEDLAADAAATARVLADAATVVGGRGAPGDVNRVVGRLAPDLPGWGDAELTARGSALARALSTGAMTPEQRNARAAEAAAYAGTAAFADAFLAGLGTEGVGRLLNLLGDGDFSAQSPTAVLLATAFGYASPGRFPGDPLASVLTATYLRADDRFGDPDVVAAGMAVVLAAGTAVGRPVMVQTLVAWGRQLVAREGVHGLAVGTVPGDAGPGWADPLAKVVEDLAATGEAGPALSLLESPRAWEALLARFWSDGGAAFGRLIELAASDQGQRGAAAVGAGLAALGAGLSDGDPANWTVDRGTAAEVAPVLGRAAAAQVGMLTEALHVGIDGELSRSSGDILRGLGFLTVNPAAAAAVESSLSSWAHTQPGSGAGTNAQQPGPAVAVPSAYLAVRQYGQRLAYAMHGFEERTQATGRTMIWNATVGSFVNIFPGRGSVVGGVATTAAASLIGADGTWDNGPDRGLVFDRLDAARAAVADLSVRGAAAAGAVARQAADAFDRTLSAMRVPRPPTSPELDLIEIAASVVPPMRIETIEAREWVLRSERGSWLLPYRHPNR